MIEWKGLIIEPFEEDTVTDDNCIVISIGKGRTLDVDVPENGITTQHVMDEQIIIRLKGELV